MLQIESRQFAKEMGLFACVQCGKCTGGCPMAMKTHLNPRNLIYRLLIAGNGFDLEGREELWDCTTCSTCYSRCPKQVNPMEAIIAMRSVFVEKGRVHPNVKIALESTFRHGNPLKLPRSDRANWAKDLQVKLFAEQGAEYLYYVGCMPSYDPRGQKVARALVQIMNTAGVDFGILGNDENCCASETRRLGELGLFEGMVEINEEIFKELEITRMFTTSPHCFNAFKNDYPKVGAQPKRPMQVQHYTQMLSGLLKEQRLNFTGTFEKKVTYHDPCYLGKHNGIFDEPRAILKRIPGVELIEMDRSREKSLCCEGGGGRMWLEGTNPGTRLAQMRVKEALETGAEILATACPFCLSTLEEAVKYVNAEEKIRVLDIAEIAVQAL
ncbi:MAG TPA: (Fe-S)-binding protein [Anaerolineales bacterium]|nr:(Fe-S)-binding protein [Anaerolineales bacterium]